MDKIDIPRLVFNECPSLNLTNEDLISIGKLYDLIITETRSNNMNWSILDDSNGIVSYYTENIETNSNILLVKDRNQPNPMSKSSYFLYINTIETKYQLNRGYQLMLSMIEKTIITFKETEY